VRIIFTERDLARVRLADTPHILGEISFSVRALRRRDVPGFEPWRGSTRPRLTAHMKPLLDLVPDHGWIPDFMEPAPAGRLPGALDAVRAATAADVAFDLARIAAERRPPPTAQALAADRKQALDRLAEAVAAYHHVAVAPYWRLIAAAFDAARVARARTLTDGGLDLLLATLHPSIRWNPPVLEIVGYRDGERLDLDGQGLLINLGVLALAPRASVGITPGGRAPVLMAPIWQRPSLAALDADGGPTAGLAALLGRTRATALRAVAAGCTTTELARAVGVAPTTASEHATVLRNARLISTRRHRNAVLHTLTPLGAALLDINGHGAPGPNKPGPRGGPSNGLPAPAVRCPLPAGWLLA
jgi:DNA-binding transcriptional ArsR family regulator